MERSWRSVVIAPTASFFGRWLWPMRVGIAILVLGATWFSYSKLASVGWWAGSGLASDPGTFLAKLPLDYDFCAAWNGEAQAGDIQERAKAEAAKQGAQLAMLATTGPVPGGEQSNLGLVLPKNARILKVFCGVTPEGSVLRECSPARCNPPMTILVENNIYTKSRGLLVTFVNKSRAGLRPAHGTLWVIWKTL